MIEPLLSVILLAVCLTVTHNNCISYVLTDQRCKKINKKIKYIKSNVKTFAWSNSLTCNCFH